MPCWSPVPSHLPTPRDTVYIIRYTRQTFILQAHPVPPGICSAGTYSISMATKKCRRGNGPRRRHCGRDGRRRQQVETGLVSDNDEAEHMRIGCGARGQMAWPSVSGVWSPRVRSQCASQMPDQTRPASQPAIVMPCQFIIRGRRDSTLVCTIILRCTPHGLISPSHDSPLWAPLLGSSTDGGYIARHVAWLPPPPQPPFPRRGHTRASGSKLVS